MHLRPRALLAASLALALVPGVASACWRDDSVWESRVADADLIGVMECVTAGVDVARYRLVEAWGGEAQVGDELTLGLYGLHLVGDRLLVVSSPSEPGPFPDVAVRYRSMISTDGAMTPLKGRALRADRRVRFEAVPLPLKDARQPLERLRAPHPTVAAFEAAARELLALDEPARELRVLQALARRHLAREAPLLERILEVDSAERAARLVIDERGPEDVVLVVGGRAATLAVLESTPGSERPAAWLRRRLDLPPRDGAPTSPPPTSPPPASPGRAVALRRLAVLEASLEPEPPIGSPPRPGDAGRLAARIAAGSFEDPYWLASSFCLLCPEERVHHFRTLLRARDPWVRVAGAVYLALEADAEGPLALEELTRLEGDPGAWAALTLARRGVASAVPRLLEVFGTEGDASGAQARLRCRARVLLSNAAAEAGVPRPPRLDAWSAETERAYRAWWEAWAHALRVRDPWLDELRAQRVD